MGLFSKKLYNAYLDESKELVFSTRQNNNRVLIKDEMKIDKIVEKCLKRKPDETSLNGNNLVLDYGSFAIKIDDYENTLPKVGSPKFTRLVCNLIQQGNVNKYRYRAINRTNKYAKQTAVVGGTILAVSLSSLLIVDSLGQDNNGVTIEVKPIVPTTTTEVSRETLPSEKAYEELVTTTESHSDVTTTTTSPTSQTATTTVYQEPDYSGEAVNINLPNDQEIDTVKQERVMNAYSDIIYSLSGQYGVDPKMLCAIACVECGSSEVNDPDSPAVGFLQLEKSALYETLELYNYSTGETETLNITSPDQLLEPGFCVKYACALMQDNNLRVPYLGEARIDANGEEEHARLKNGLLEIITYNKGIGGAQTIIEEYCQASGANYQDVIENPYETGFTEYISHSAGGDDDYLYKVLGYMVDENNEASFYMTDIDGNQIYYNVNTKSLTR